MILKDKLSFYNTIYEREVQRFKDLNDGINAPITILTLLVSILYFIYSKINLKCLEILSIVILVLLAISFILVVISLIFLSLSFNNFLKGFNYIDLPKTSELYKYDKDVEEFNPGTPKKDKIDFEDYVIKEYVRFSDDWAEKNDRRAISLYRAKTMLVSTFFIELLAISLYVIKSNI